MRQGSASTARLFGLRCSRDRVIGGAIGAFGSGNGDWPRRPRRAGFGFGFFGRIGLLCAFGGGPAGCSSATTGLGSIDGRWRAWRSRRDCGSPATGTVAGWNLGSVKVTEKPVSGAATETEQGVLQPGPTDVLASAPGGWIRAGPGSVGGVDLK